MIKKILSLFICIAVVLSLCSCSFLSARTSYEGDLIAHFIDVGQGDCILLESQDDFVLIDAGEAEYSATVCQYLKNNDVSSIDYVIATHPHSDHCGGLTEVIETFSVDNFITVETDQQTKTWLNVLYAVDNNNVNYIDAKVHSTYTFGNSSFEIMGPYGKSYEGYNDYSVVVKAECGNTSFLLTGDAEKKVEHEMIENGADLSADVLKVGHHGSSTSSCNEFLDAVDPSYAVIMCGMYNDYGHPHVETINSLNARNIATYRTDILGTVVAVSDGSNIEFFYDNEEISVTTSKNDTSLSYIGNKNSRKFHLSSCSGAKDIKKKNRVIFDKREEAINNGYTPCKTCNP
ncbi:MAG: MBL fold metallo-hydrolase [Ruminococcus sp.]|nr:MBL fold metallo-hydrolase [Ruminococcus sp.]